MATSTTNLHLTKPDYTDLADIAVINSNMDTIDSAIKALQDFTSSSSSILSSIGVVPVANGGTGQSTASGARAYVGSIPMVESATAAATMAKETGSLPGFELFDGARVSVKFSNLHDLAGAVTLNVASTGAKAVYVQGAATASTNPVVWSAGAICDFVYDATNSAWHYLGNNVDGYYDYANGLSWNEIGGKFTWNDVSGQTASATDTYTENLNLVKPGGASIVDVDDINDNMDILDGAVAAKLDEDDYLAGLTWNTLKAKFTWDELSEDPSTDTHTTNLNLSKPSRLSTTAINGNMDILDAKLGAVGDTSVQSQLTSLRESVYYKVGDTISYTAYNPSGIITSSASKVQFNFITPKLLDNITSIQVTAIRGGIRGPKGYIDETTDSSNLLSLYTFEAVKSSSNGSFQLIISKSSAFTNVDNNSPVSGYINAAFTLS